jgi:hypothetical protein
MMAWAETLVEKMDNNRHTKNVYTKKMEGKRPKGRPRQRWRDSLEKYLKTIGNYSCEKDDQRQSKMEVKIICIKEPYRLRNLKINCLCMQLKSMIDLHAKLQSNR